MPDAATVALAGVGGYGDWHLRNVHRLHRAGLVRLVAACDPEPAGEARTRLGPVPLYPGLAELLDRHRPDVTVIASPIQTHAELAALALGAGCDVLLEKPPLTSLAGLAELTGLAGSVGRSVQVGFQSLGSRALPALAELVEAGTLGRVTGVGAAGTWVRSFAYYRRAPWAGRCVLDGQAVVDGALTNPFAHAVATAFAVAAPRSLAEAPAELAVELYRAYEIEADDTACLSAGFDGAPPVLVAATVCGEQDHDPYVVVHGEQGSATLHYERDLLTVHTRHGGSRQRAYERDDLLADLVEHRAGGRRGPLLAPLAASTAFTAVVEKIRNAERVRQLPARHWHDVRGERRVIHGIDRAVRRAAEELKPFSGLGLPWAEPA